MTKILKVRRISLLVIQLLLVNASLANFHPLYEWKTDYNRSIQQIIPWRNTWLQVTNENLVYINSIDPRSEIPINCTFKANFEPNEDVKALSLENDKVVVYQSNSIVVTKLPSCTRVGNMLRDSCRHMISNKDSFDCHYLRADDYVGPVNIGRLGINDGRLIKQFNVSGITSAQQYNLTLGKFPEPVRSDRAYYLIEKLREKCENNEPNCDLSKLKILDSSYNLREEHSFQHPITQFRSFSHNQLTFCHVEQDLKRTHPDGFFTNVLICNIYDERLRPKTSSRMDLAHEVNDWVERAVAVHNLIDGGVLVLYHPNKKFRKVFYRLIDSSGRVGRDDLEFYEFTSNDFYYEGDIDLQLFEKSSENRDYCAIMVKFSETVGKCGRFI